MKNSAGEFERQCKECLQWEYNRDNLTKKDLEHYRCSECEQCLSEEIKRNLNSVSHPAHYQSEAGIEVINIIEAFKLDFHLGNSIKYILRAGKKGDYKEDIKKSIWYLKRHLELIDSLD